MSKSLRDGAMLYIYDGVAQHGPFELSIVKKLWTELKIRPESYYWVAGMAEWEPMLGVFPATKTNQKVIPKPPIIIAQPAMTPVIGEDINVKERKPKVLIVDDDMLIREMIGDLLDEELIEYEKISDIKKAYQLLEEQGLEMFDAILTDYQTKGATGIEFARWVKKRENALQVLLLTAQDDKELVKAGLRAGVMDFLVKPIYPKTFLLAVHEAIQKTRQHREEREAYMEVAQLKWAGRGSSIQNLMKDLVQREKSVSGLSTKLETLISYSEEIEKTNQEVFPDSHVYATNAAFQGLIKDLSILDLAQLFSQSGKTGELQVFSTDKEWCGSIFFLTGRLVHSAYGSLTGQDALSRVMSETTGSFCFHYGKKTDKHSFTEDTTSVLLSVSAAMDEMERTRAA